MNKLKYLFFLALITILFTACPEGDNKITIIKQQVGYIIKDELSFEKFKFELDKEMFNLSKCANLKLRLYRIKETKGPDALDYANFEFIFEKDITGKNALEFSNTSSVINEKEIKKNQNYLWEVVCKNGLTETRDIFTFTTSASMSKPFQGLNGIINNGFVTPDSNQGAIKNVRVTRYPSIPKSLCIHTMSGGDMLTVDSEGDTLIIGGKGRILEITFLDNPRVGEVDLSSFTFDSPLNMEFKNTISIDEEATIDSELESNAFYNEVDNNNLLTSYYKLFGDDWTEPDAGTVVNSLLDDYTSWNSQMTITNDHYLPNGNNAYPKICYFKVRTGIDLSFPPSTTPDKILNNVCYLTEDGGLHPPMPIDYAGYYDAATSTGHISDHVLINNFIFAH